jgi:pimeloyl-ACP methyl ester carboxylesterase
MTVSSTGARVRFATARLATGPLIHFAEQGDPDGEAVIFIHGWPDSWFSFSRVLDLLPARYHAFALDQRGFGDSERPAAGYTIDQLASDVVAFMDAVGVDRATLVGHSMGTFVSRRVAEIAPAQVSRLILIGSAITVANEVTHEVHAMLAPLTDPLPVEFVREFQACTIHHPVPEPFFDGLVAASLQAPARVWQRTFDGLLAFDDSAQLGRIAAPTLILWGDRDALFADPEEQRRLAAAIPGALLSILPETGHSPNWERPERVAAEIEAFLIGSRQGV